MTANRALLVGLLTLGAWIVSVFWLWERNQVAALALLGISSIALILTMWGRGGRGPDLGAKLDPAQAEAQARFLVTQMLATLTRAQVGYLCQDFDDASEGRAWLKRTLPRTYRDMLDQLVSDLEAARGGERPESLDLALRVLDKREALQNVEKALNEQRESHEGHAVATPVVYVITGDVDLEGEGAKPEVQMLASVDLEQPTLLPAVDRVNVFEQLGGERRIRGQCPFKALRSALSGKLRKVSSDPLIYATDAVEDTPKVALSTPPVGFVIGGAELA